LSTLLTAFGVITGAIGLLGLYSFISHVRVTPGVQEPQNPFSARFIIDNGSIFAIRNISVACEVHRAQISGLTLNDASLHMTEQIHVSVIPRDSQAAIQCGIIGNVPAQSADMTLSVSYQYLWTQRQTVADFVLLDSGNWVPKLPSSRSQ